MSSLFPNSHTENSAKYLSGIKQFNFLNRFNKGLVFGNYRITVKRSMQNAIIVGGIGTSKTVSFIVPNLMKLRNGSIYVLDPSQELFDLTSSHLSKFFEIFCINLGDISKSHFWNPLAKATTKDDMQMIADAIISAANPNETGDSKFWNDGAKSLLTTLLYSVLKKSEYKNLHYIYTLLNRINSHDKEALTKELSTSLDKDAWLEWKAIVSQPEKILGSQIATAKVALSPFSSAVLKEVSSRSNIDFSTFRKKRSILYICVPEHRLKEHGLYLSLLFREIFETLMEMPEKKDLIQYLLLDEGGNIFVPKLANYITILRKRKASVSLILQSFQQLQSLYGADAQTIIDNAVNHLYFPGLSLSTCQEISQKIGNKVSNGASKYFPTNTKGSSTKSPLISPESIRTLKNGRGLLLSGNMPAKILMLTPWFKRFSMRLKLTRKK